MKTVALIAIGAVAVVDGRVDLGDAFHRILRQPHASSRDPQRTGSASSRSNVCEESALSLDAKEGLQNPVLTRLA